MARGYSYVLAVCIAVALSAGTARAGVVYTDPTDITITVGQSSSFQFGIAESPTGFAMDYYGDWRQPYIAGGNGAYTATGSYPILARLSAGTTIDGTLNWINVGDFFSNSGASAWYNAGAAPLVVDGYVGLKFADAAHAMHYGWAQFSFDAGNHSLTLKDYAYESVAGVGITAGDAGVPAPSTLTASGALLVGVVAVGAVRRRRRMLIA